MSDPKPTDVVLHCPVCGRLHIDQPNPTIGWTNPSHKSHLCRVEDGGCGTVWRPADVPTNGVERVQTRGKADTWPELEAGRE
jgi:hypothetical protein